MASANSQGEVGSASCDCTGQLCQQTELATCASHKREPTWSTEASYDSNPSYSSGGRSANFPCDSSTSHGPWAPSAAASALSLSMEGVSGRTPCTPATAGVRSLPGCPVHERSTHILPSTPGPPLSRAAEQSAAAGWHGRSAAAAWSVGIPAAPHGATACCSRGMDTTAIGSWDAGVASAAKGHATFSHSKTGTHMWSQFASSCTKARSGGPVKKLSSCSSSLF